MEIGRKPLRPLAADGNDRLDVADQTKSMSKRHALLTVNDNGSAVVRDLGSTNGSYVVRDNGDLLRLPANADFLLPSSPMRMQFGDVPADFIRIDNPEDDDHKPVPDLFGYAASDAPQEPDAADMSVDDILDLRAGEPTAIFSAASVQRKIDELEIGNLNLVQLNQKPEEPALPRDLFADAASQQKEVEEQRKVKETMDSVALPAQKPASATTQLRPGVRISGVVPVDAIAHPVTHTNTPAQGDQPAASEAEAQPNSPAEATAETAKPIESAPVSETEAPTTAPDQSEADAQPSQQPTGAQPLVFVPMNQSADGQVSSDADQSAAENPSAAQPEQASAAADDAAIDDATGTYTPAFEPGSVFDRVAKGELKAQEPVVEVDGLTSNDAKTTQDFSLQFEIARHPELLVFLAMNPYLYDDMYAWLAARGEADIDEALAHNTGYQEYREAVGK
nr:FHA domain-containing protein [Bifidobacterium colobi]